LLNSFSSLLDSSGIGAVIAQFGSEVGHPQFWLNLSKIVWINVLLSGDNAAGSRRASGFGAWCSAPAPP
jgi:hypothetical protein